MVYWCTGILVYGTFILVYWHTGTSVVYWYAVYFVSGSTLYKLVLMLLPFMHSCGMVYWCIGVLVYKMAAPINISAFTQQFYHRETNAHAGI